MKTKRKLAIFGLAGLIIGTPLEALHVKTGVLVYKNPTLGLQAWWVPILFALAGILLCEGHHQLRKKLKIKTPTVSNSVVVLSLLVFIAVYGSSGFLKDIPYMAYFIYLLVFSISAAYLWLEPKKLLFILAVV